MCHRSTRGWSIYPPRSLVVCGNFDFGKVRNMFYNCDDHVLTGKIPDSTENDTFPEIAFYYYFLRFFRESCNFQAGSGILFLANFMTSICSDAGAGQHASARAPNYVAL